MPTGIYRHKITHGHSCVGELTPEYRAYNGAKQRCQNKNRRDYKHYGGRGIEFRFKSFEEFIKHIGLKPSPALTLDRKSVNKHYEKGNVRWATWNVQATNQRPWNRTRENNPNAKLNAAQVSKIRALKGTLSGRKVAKLFGLAFSHVYEIWSNKKWKEIKC